jgi:hypothetical protein
VSPNAKCNTALIVCVGLSVWCARTGIEKCRLRITYNQKGQIFNLFPLTSIRVIIIAITLENVKVRPVGSKVGTKLGTKLSHYTFLQKQNERELIIVLPMLVD